MTLLFPSPRKGKQTRLPQEAGFSVFDRNHTDCYFFRLF